MQIYYVDECGDHSMLTSPGDQLALKAGSSRYFVLAGVGIRDSSRRPLAEKLFAIKRKHFGGFAKTHEWGQTEIKGRYLFRAARSVANGHVLRKPEGYRALTTPAQVSELIKDLGLVFTSFRPIIFATAIDKLEMLATERNFHPVAIAYTYMHQRVALTMEDLYVGDASIIVADQQTQHEALFRAGHFRDTRGALTKNLPRKPNYDLVLDKPLWVDTALSSWDREIIQLADIAAYSVAECMTRVAAPSEANYLWQQIKGCMAAHTRTGKALGAGFSIYPKTAKAPEM